MSQVAPFFFLAAIAVACLTGFIAIQFFGVDDAEFRQMLYEEAEG